MAKTIIISNRLPVKIHQDNHGLTLTPSAGGLATGLGSIYKQGNNLWVGWPGLFLHSEEDQKKVTAELRKESMVPIFLHKEHIKKYYEGFSNSTLWPLFHYYPQLTEYNTEDWEAYVEVNNIFCTEILKHAEPDDTIWVHDYQLLLLPEMLRKALPKASIGYFHHIPFPSYEIFRLLPWREPLVNGLLGADLIGFHTFDDMRHFLSTVSRTTGLDHEMGHFKHQGRFITVDAFPMGIDYEKYASSVTTEAVQKERKRFLSSTGNQRLILSIDRLDYTKGIPERIIAFDQLLTQFPEYRQKVSLILLVVPSRDTVTNYTHLKEELELLVGRINGKYGNLEWTPVHFFYRALPFNQLSALYSISDIALVTPLRDGMNLVCKEFVASKTDRKGVLVLSEMAGAAKELTEALIINPNDQEALVQSMRQALEMPLEEQALRLGEMQKTLQRYTIHRWVEVFMERLRYTKESQANFRAKILGRRMQQEISDEFHTAQKRLLLLDYDGTLRSFTQRPTDAKPDAKLREILRELAENPLNHVVIISGRDRRFLTKWLGDLNVGFVAEHGAWIKQENQEWHTIASMPQEWKQEILPMLEYYVDRTPGSLIEHKDYSLVWHFRKSEHGLGEMRARELVSNLQYLTGNMDIQVLEGNKVIEIKNAGINKGRASMNFVDWIKPDFILAIGDDWTDEDTFKSLPDDAYTIKVGNADSAAKFKLKSVDEVLHFLIKLTDMGNEKQSVA